MRNREEIRLHVKPLSQFTIKGDVNNYQAFDDNSEPPCGDPDCNCGGRYVVGSGDTPDAAVADFWEQWEDRHGDEASA